MNAVAEDVSRFLQANRGSARFRVPATALQFDALLRKGLALSVADAAASTLGVTRERLARLIRISPSTLERRFKEKADLTGAREGWNVALMPYVKAPIARRPIGNRAWEGGVLVPIDGGLGEGWSIDLTPELDVVADEAGGGHHLALANVVGVDRDLGGGVTATAELWGQVDFDPAGTTRQYSFDLALAWIPARQPNLQFDGGVNFGLNRETPDVEVYVGISRRF